MKRSVGTCVRSARSIKDPLDPLDPLAEVGCDGIGSAAVQSNKAEEAGGFVSMFQSGSPSVHDAAVDAGGVMPAAAAATAVVVGVGVGVGVGLTDTAGTGAGEGSSADGPTHRTAVTSMGLMSARSTMTHAPDETSLTPVAPDETSLTPVVILEAVDTLVALVAAEVTLPHSLVFEAPTSILLLLQLLLSLLLLLLLLLLSSKVLILRPESALELALALALALAIAAFELLAQIAQLICTHRPSVVGFNPPCDTGQRQHTMALKHSDIGKFWKLRYI